MDYRRLHAGGDDNEMLEVVISREVLEEKKDMDYSIAKKIYAGEINAVPEFVPETDSETDPKEDQ